MDEEWESNSTESEDNDLREKFSRGELMSGHLYKQQITEDSVDYAKTINNISGIKRSLLNLKQGYSEKWIERMTVNVPLIAVTDNDSSNKSNEIDIKDDYKRELSFYQQAQNGVISAFATLKGMQIQTERPGDYFAEMLKSEGHMQRVREKLVTQEKREETRERVRKDRENRKKIKAERKMGKRKLKSDRSGGFIRAGDEMEGEGDSREDGVKKRKIQENSKSPAKKLPMKGRLDRNANATNKRREWKDRKFGFGGKTGKDRKRNSAQSSADMSSFRSYKNSKPPLKKSNLNKRPGKMRRHQSKMRKESTRN
eukprot:TRINITY_DN13977_c0_g1_i1.p1 TRINITY_DN13977_c0_g1~~TRINITY_DN13977_c0_g1_i1.p1  ORF type:complete len:312 (+),score=84.20 TRINITY_DN13977_c0_g1_i1:39-974(+)